MSKKEKAETVLEAVPFALLSEKEIADWRDSTARVGTACKCGTHASISWPDGGKEWFEGHVLEHHVSPSKKLAGVILDLPLDPPLTESQRAAIIAAITGGDHA